MGLTKTGFSEICFCSLVSPFRLIRQFKVRYDANFVDIMVKDYDSKVRFL